ncbi:helix-turn-helix domain-containing protein [Luteococcus sp. OSA5]|uniref:helix-turn-helix domain-containing protein n=1 Tax=Luteococcus sp. OSA5 TaxID=3401630 RepID=UPI003B42E73E
MADEQSFAQRFSRAVDESGLSLEQLSAQLMVRGARISPSTLQAWAEGRETPSPRSDLTVLRALERLLPSVPLTMVHEANRQAGRVWDPLVAIPRGHPERARLADVRSMTQQQFEVPVLHVSTVLRSNLSVMERSIHLVAQPLGAFRHDPSLLMLVPAGATTEVLDGQDRHQVSDPVRIDDRHDLVHVSSRRSSTTRAGQLIVNQMTFRISTPGPIRSIPCVLPGPVNLFSLDVTFKGRAPDAVTRDYQPEHTAPVEEVPLEPGSHVQYATQDAPVGLYQLRW